MLIDLIKQLTDQLYCLPYYHSLFLFSRRVLIALISHLCFTASESSASNMFICLFTLVSWVSSPRARTWWSNWSSILSGPRSCSSLTLCVCVTLNYSSLILKSLKKKENQCFKYIMHNPQKTKKRWYTWTLRAVRVNAVSDSLSQSLIMWSLFCRCLTRSSNIALHFFFDCERVQKSTLMDAPQQKLFFRSACMSH